MQHPQYTETPINHLYGNLEAILLRIFARLNASLQIPVLFFMPTLHDDPTCLSEKIRYCDRELGLN